MTICLIVKNIPYDCYTNEFEKVMRQIKGIVDYKLVYKKGYGYINVDTDENVSDLLKADLHIRNRILRFSKYKTERYCYREKTIFIKNIPKNITNDTLLEIFKINFGQIKHIILYFNSDGNSTGNCSIEFENNDSYQKALNQRILVCDFGTLIIHAFRYKI